MQTLSHFNVFIIIILCGITVNLFICPLKINIYDQLQNSNKKPRIVWQSGAIISL